jgi:hypothetical protein
MPNTTTTGAAGEHYVMCQLLRRGLIAALAPVGVPNADIIVTDFIGDKLCAIQVKTRAAPGRDNGWHMSAKHESIQSPNIYYCFVGFETDPPECWIVPSAIVAKVLKLSHSAWLTEPGRRGRPHRDNKMRRFRHSYESQGLNQYASGWLEEYRDARDLLKKATRK